VAARLEVKINEACLFFEKKPQEMAQVGWQEGQLLLRSFV
jgi:hypothetical protein